MLTPGIPEMLNGAVYGTEPIPPTGCPAISNGGGPSATNALVSGAVEGSTAAGLARGRVGLVGIAGGKQRREQIRSACVGISAISVHSGFVNEIGADGPVIVEGMLNSDGGVDRV